jgi:hypothetical protein
MSTDLDRELDRLEQRLPPRIARFVRWGRQPGTAWARWPLSLVLIVGGIFSFLPVLGLWMLPLGFVLIAQDVPLLRRPMGWIMAWINDRWGRETRPADQSVGREPDPSQPRPVRHTY